MLINALDEVSHPEGEAAACDRRVLGAVYAHLSRPASGDLQNFRARGSLN